VTLERLDKALNDSGIIQNSYKCVEADKTNIKDELREACRKETLVQIAWKYCLEEQGG
jgi:hypothetical protein